MAVVTRHLRTAFRKRWFEWRAESGRSWVRGDLEVAACCKHQGSECKGPGVEGSSTSPKDRGQAPAAAVCPLHISVRPQRVQSGMIFTEEDWEPPKC